MKTLEELSEKNPIVLEELKKTLSPKAYQEFLDMTKTTDIADFEVKIFTAVEQVAVESSEGRALVRIKDLKGQATDRFTVPKEQVPLEPEDVAEGVTVVPVKIGIDPKVIALTKRWGEGVAISQDAIDDCQTDLITLSLESVGKGFAQKEDKFIFTTLLREVDVPDEDIAGNIAATTYTFAHNPSLQIIRILADAVDVTAHLEVHDMYHGKFKMDNDNSGKTLHCHYTYTTHTLVVDAATDGTLAYADVTTAFALSRNLYEKQTVIVGNPRGVSQMITDTKFISAYEGSGKLAPVVSGEIGEFAGLRVLNTTRVIEGAALCLDPKRFVWIVTKGGMYEKTYSPANNDSHEFYFYERMGGDVVNGSAAALIVNIGAKSGPL